MRYFSVYIIREKDSGERDALNNPIYIIDKTRVSGCRVTEWTAEDVSLYGREVTTNARKIIAKPYGGSVDDVVSIEIKGKEYEVEKVVDLNRWILFIVRGYKS